MAKARKTTQTITKPVVETVNTAMAASASALPEINGTNANNTLNGTNAAESIRAFGGIDTVYAGGGNDIIYGGDGYDSLWGQGGADTFVIKNGDTGIDFLGDYSIAAGDKIDISDLLGAYNPLTGNVTDFVKITESHTRSYLWVDKDGADTAQGWTQVATTLSLLGTNDVAALVNGGSLIVKTAPPALPEITGTDGTDTLRGTAGAEAIRGLSGIDYLYGEGGDDIFYGGDGYDFLFGGAGADTFVVGATDTAIDFVADFNKAQGDVLDISALLDAYDPLTHALTNFVDIRESHVSTYIWVDKDGAGTAHNWTQVATFQNITGLTDQETALVASGNLLV